MSERAFKRAEELARRGRWRQQVIAEHIAHAVVHLDSFGQLASSRGRPATQDAEEELAHAATRALMALEVLLRARAATESGR
jgi:hypothetical protein